METGSDPLVSVVLPTYNRGHFLRQAVDSVVRQTCSDWELTVVDDGSTDGSTEYVASLHDRRIRLVAIDHSGNPAHARNVGLARCRGRWIAFLDSDDLWLPAKLETQLDALRRHSTARWSCTGFDFIDASGVAVPQRSGAPYEPLSGWILEPLILFRATTPVQTLIAERSLMAEADGFDESLAPREDYDLALRLACRSELCALAEHLTLIREHPDRTTHGMHVADLHAVGALVFRKAARAATARHVRRLCFRQCAAQLVARARVLSREGRHRDALASAASAAFTSPEDPLVWRAAAGCTARAVVGAIPN